MTSSIYIKILGAKSLMDFSGQQNCIVTAFFNAGKRSTLCVSPHGRERASKAHEWILQILPVSFILVNPVIHPLH